MSVHFLQKLLSSTVRFSGSSSAQRATGAPGQQQQTGQPLLRQSLEAARRTAPMAMLLGLQTKHRQLSTSAQCLKRRSAFYKPGWTDQRSDEVDIVLPPTAYLVTMAFILSAIYCYLDEF